MENLGSGTLDRPLYGRVVSIMHGGVHGNEHDRTVAAQRKRRESHPRNPAQSAAAGTTGLVALVERRTCNTLVDRCGGFFVAKCIDRARRAVLSIPHQPVRTRIGRCGAAVQRVYDLSAGSTQAVTQPSRRTDSDCSRAARPCPGVPQAGYARSADGPAQQTLCPGAPDCRDRSLTTTWPLADSADVRPRWLQTAERPLRSLRRGSGTEGICRTPDQSNSWLRPGGAARWG